MKPLSDQAQLLLKFRNHPEEFFKAAWPDVYLWDKLSEVLDAVKNNRRVVVPSGHGVGKTWIEARIALWFLVCFPPAKIITTAPTWPQVEKLLWSEIKHAYTTSKIPIGGRLLTTELKITEEWFAAGFSTSGKADEREFGTPKFQGFHSENLFVLIDEAPGVKHEIWISIESLIVSDNNRVLAMGNPTSPVGDFFEACKSPFWKKIEISSLDHPNVKEGITVVPGAVTKQWVEERRQEWGEDSPLWFAKVLGKFPAEGTDTLIPLAWAEACINLDLPRTGSKKAGIDVARFGEDKTTIAIFEGQVLLPIEEYAKKDTSFTAGRVKVLHRQMNFDAIGVDDTGVGGGVTDALTDDEIDVDAMVAGAVAIDTVQFDNLTAEIHWNLREAIRKKEISLPDDKILINQLCSRKYKFTRNGKIRLESKDEMKKRGLKSPDRADCVAIAYSAGRNEDVGQITIISMEDED